MTALSKQDRYHRLYLDIALRCREMSHAQRRKVGAVIVKDGRILSMGWNGMPAGMTNVCETRRTFAQDQVDRLDIPLTEYYRDDETDVLVRLITKPEVIHAEANAICKLAKSGDSAAGSVLYVTLAPCIECAKMIIQAGISEVHYIKPYKSDSGLKLLSSCEIVVAEWSKAYAGIFV